jgi:hypothetical protein
MLDHVEVVRFGSTAQRWIRRQQTSDAEVLQRPFPVDAGGFLDTSSVEADQLVQPSGIAASERGWVLLGPPGSGKTTTVSIELERLTNDLEQREAQFDAVRVSGSDLVDRADVDELLGSHLERLPAADARAVDPVEQLILIDGLDESRYLRHFANWLKRALVGRDTRGLRIWVTCRAVEYPEQLTEVITASLGSCVVGDLAPLTREDARELIVSVGTDAAALLDAASGTVAGLLATTPLMLRVLLTAYRRSPDVLSMSPV